MPVLAQPPAQIVMAALREPTPFVDRPPTVRTLAALAGAATLGIGAYGGAVHGAEGLVGMLGGAGRAVFAAGTAWTLAVPSLVVLGALQGTRIGWRQAVLATLVTVNFGGLAFLASVPVVTLIELSSPWAWTRQAINTLVVLAVGGSATLVFERAMAHLEGRRALHRVFMALFGALFIELAWLCDLFRFTG